MRFNAAQSIKNLFKPVDLTKGKPYKQLIIFMIPILISYIFQQVYTISGAACFRGTPDPALDGLQDDAPLLLGGPHQEFVRYWSCHWFTFFSLIG